MRSGLRRALSGQALLIGALDLLGTPASVLGFAHVAGGLNGGKELEGDICDTGDSDDATGNLADNQLAEEQGAEEDVEDTTADEGEEERGMSRHLGRNLELKKADDKTKNNHIAADNDRLHAELEDVRDTTQKGDDANSQVDNAEDVGELHGCCS